MNNFKLVGFTKVSKSGFVEPIFEKDSEYYIQESSLGFEIENFLLTQFCEKNCVFLPKAETFSAQVGSPLLYAIKTEEAIFFGNLSNTLLHKLDLA